MSSVSTKKLWHCMPHFRAHSILDITPAFLRNEDVDLLLVDADLTILLPGRAHPNPQIVDHLHELKQVCAVCVISNTTKVSKIALMAMSLGIKHVVSGWRFWCLKPSPLCLYEAMDTIGKQPYNTMMIGDQLTDIQAAYNAGCRAVLVDPLVKDGYHWSTRLFKLRKQNQIFQRLINSGDMPDYLPTTEPPS